MQIIDSSFNAFYLRNFGTGSPASFTSPVLNPNIVLRGGPGQYPSILFRNGPTAATQILSATGPGNLYLDAPGLVAFRGVLDNDSYTRMILDSSGRLGIGTTTPGARLHLGDGAVASVNQAVLIDGNLSAVNAGHAIDFQGAGSQATAGAYARVAGVTDSGGIGGVLTFYTTPNFGTAVSERMRIDRQGNIGVGTTSPAATLDVNGNGILKGLALPVSATKTSTYNATVNDFLIPCDTSSSGFSVNLPQLSTVPAGLLLSIKKTSSDSNTLTIDGYLSETIDGQLTQTTTTRYKNFLLCAASSGWHILSTYL